MNIHLIRLAAASTALCLLLSGCANSDKKNNGNNKNDKNNSSSQGEPDQNDSSDSSNSQTADSKDDGNTQKEPAQLGEYLQKTENIYNTGKYTLECVITGDNIDGEIKLTRVADGENFYQLQEESLGSYGRIISGGKSYDFDFACNMYRPADGEKPLNVVEEIKDLGLACTSPQQNSAADDDNYIVEEYVYTGDTYITALDFYFDKDSGDLVKYNTTYSVEGEDDIVETREIVRLDNTADSSVFDTSFIDGLENFDEMTEDQRLGFCQGLCGSFNISTDMMYDAAITTDDLKTISYEDFFRLVYNYGSK